MHLSTACTGAHCPPTRLEGGLPWMGKEKSGGSVRSGKAGWGDCAGDRNPKSPGRLPVNYIQVDYVTNYSGIHGLKTYLTIKACRVQQSAQFENHMVVFDIFLPKQLLTWKLLITIMKIKNMTQWLSMTKNVAPLMCRIIVDNYPDACN